MDTNYSSLLLLRTSYDPKLHNMYVSMVDWKQCSINWPGNMLVAIPSWLGAYNRIEFDLFWETSASTKKNLFPNQSYFKLYSGRTQSSRLIDRCIYDEMITLPYRAIVTTCSISRRHVKVYCQQSYIVIIITNTFSLFLQQSFYCILLIYTTMHSYIHMQQRLYNDYIT